MALISSSIPWLSRAISHARLLRSAAFIASSLCWDFWGTRGRIVTISGQGPGARSTSHYSKVWVQILNLWNTPGLCAPFTPCLTSYLLYSKFPDTTTSSTCTPSPMSQDQTLHICFNVDISIPSSSPVYNSGQPFFQPMWYSMMWLYFILRTPDVLPYNELINGFDAANLP